MIGLEKEIETLKHDLFLSEFFRTDTLRLLSETLWATKTPQFVYSISLHCGSALKVKDSSENESPQILLDQFGSALSRRLSRVWMSLSFSIKKSAVTLLPLSGTTQPSYKVVVVFSEKAMARKLNAFFESLSFSEMMQSFHCHRFRISDPKLNR